jgi:signal peptidase I
MAREVLTPVEQEPTEHGKRGVVAFFKELPVLIALALVIALVIKAFLVQAFFIPSGSMEPTLQIGDRVLVNKLTYRFHDPRRGDVVVFRDPLGDKICEQRPGITVPEHCNRGVGTKVKDWFVELFGLPTAETKDYIKRIVALPGETIQIENGEIYVCGEPNCTPLDAAGQPKDGRKITFPSTAEEGPQIAETQDYPATHIPEHQYWVMGDNRANSSDSTTFGSIGEDKVVGKAFVLVWPPNRFSGL